jgi:carbon monoxide dehydrogenase subunit G
MKLEQSFTVQAPIATVWAALVDVQRVAPCLPGAQITEAGDDGSYKGTFTVKLGPTTAAYNGSLKMEEIDEAAHRATMSAKGTDKRGQGGATATIVSTMAQEDGGGTRVDVVTDFSITGRLARFGRSGMIEDISNRLLRDFASCLQAQLEGDQASGGAGAPAQGSGADAAALAESGATGPEAATQAAAAPVPPSSSTPPAAAPPAAKPISGLSLFFGALMDRLRRLFRRRT